MRLTIHHRTRYRYARPVVIHPHRLMLHPRGGHDLKVVSMMLTCDPAASIHWMQDVLGNSVATASFARPAADLVITSHVVVDQMADAWPVLQLDNAALSYPFAYGADELANLGRLCPPQPHDASDPTASWARGFVLGERTDTLSLLKDLNAGVLGAVSYQTRDEEGVQPAGETLAAGRGSCRDLAALLIEAVRSLGFGARAVSGYLFDPQAPTESGGTTHAWAEVYLPGAGWIAFDPTHGRMGGANLIPVGVGPDFRGLAPAEGGYGGAPEDFLGMDVVVNVSQASI
jgi:transglutaminase-like putative cysteine protease